MSSFPSGMAPERGPQTRSLFAALAAAAVLGAQLVMLLGSPALAGDQKPKSVLELFTSQGCSSCPPADALLGKLAQRDDIVALTMPVNYWDHLGWRDTLAKEAFTERQRAYAEARGDREIYTPQLVVNGVAHVVGSRADDIEEALRRTSRTLGEAQVTVSLRNDGEAVLLQAGAGSPDSAFRGGTLWLAFFSHTVQVDIRRGENYGHKITYTNVVRYLQPAGRWDGEAVSYRMAIPNGPNIDGCAAFLQADGSKFMLGAAIAHLAGD